MVRIENESMNKKLYLCGTGMRLGQLTLEACAALKNCERIFCVNLPKEVFQKFKEVFPRAEDGGGCLPSKRPFSDKDACARILSCLPAKKEAGVVFMGHPLLYTLAPQLTRHCRRRGVEYHIFPGVSSVDGVVAVLDSDLYSSAFCVYGAAELLRRKPTLDCGASTILLNISRLSKKTTAYLARFYGADHPAYLVECGTERGTERRIRAALKDLAKIDRPGATLVVLPRRK